MHRTRWQPQANRFWPSSRWDMSQKGLRQPRVLWSFGIEHCQNGVVWCRWVLTASQAPETKSRKPHQVMVVEQRCWRRHCPFSRQLPTCSCALRMPRSTSMPTQDCHGMPQGGTLILAGVWKETKRKEKRNIIARSLWFDKCRSHTFVFWASGETLAGRNCMISWWKTYVQHGLTMRGVRAPGRFVAKNCSQALMGSEGLLMKNWSVNI